RPATRFEADSRTAPIWPLPGLPECIVGPTAQFQTACQPVRGSNHSPASVGGCESPAVQGPGAPTVLSLRKECVMICAGVQDTVTFTPRQYFTPEYRTHDNESMLLDNIRHRPPAAERHGAGTERQYRC